MSNRNFQAIKKIQMGSTFASLMEKLFIGCLKREEIEKFIKQGKVLSWTRFADDTVAILEKGLYDTL